MPETIKYLPFECLIDTAFWHILARKKLEEYCLSQGPFKIIVNYTNSLAIGLNPRVTIAACAFQDQNTKKSQSPIHEIIGELTILNSLAEFKSLDKQAFINEYGQGIILCALKDNYFLKNPNCLLMFQLLTYCDLKHHQFYVWPAYPAIMNDRLPKLISSRNIRDEFVPEVLTSLLLAYNRWRQSHSAAFFVVQPVSVSDVPQVFVKDLEHIDLADPTMYLVFSDPSTHSTYPGWPLRNMLFLLSSLIHSTTSLKVICFRERFIQGQQICEHSLVLNVELSAIDPSTFNHFVGWEKTNNQLKPRIVDLRDSMDPLKLSESSVELNLKLMKWRLMPELDLDVLKNTKCLLIGAGTLGCNVSRQLLAWGVRTITFVDNGSVSLSNPIRQSLFVFDDAKQGGKSKAEAAASALSQIFPGVQSKGFKLSIPMPGHSILTNSSFDPASSQLPTRLDVPVDQLTLEAQILEAYIACSRLSEMINAHDVIFLLTDTRESRWLPTFLSNTFGKLVINAALGFDTYLVMRHGVSRKSISANYEIDTQSSNCTDMLLSTTIRGSSLGCYFCSDVVGPTNSTLNRSIDQQCTVTRPGVSMIAAAIAVELCISVLQHPSKLDAPASLNPPSLTYYPLCASLASHLLPHQIRGFLTQYNQILPATSAFTRCSACSDLVLRQFEQDGFIFLLRVFNHPDYLEQICGLKDLQNQCRGDEVIALSDEEN